MMLGSSAVRQVKIFLPYDAMLARYTAYYCSASVSVCAPQTDVLSKWLNVLSRKKCSTIAQIFEFSDVKYLGKIPTGSS